MSKKLYSTAKWKKRIRNAQVREAYKQARKRPRHRTPYKPKHYPEQVKYLFPPKTFSLISNPIETAGFLTKLATWIPLSKVFIESKEVEIITPDTALALLATIKKFPKRAVQGSVPLAETPRRILKQSGFFEHVRHRVDMGETKPGVFTRYNSKLVDGELAQRLIVRGTEVAFGEPSQSEAAYCVLLEGMQNTVDHAHYSADDNPDEDESERERWWAAVYPDEERKRVCFAMLDTGVGILRSAKLKTLRELGLVLNSASDVGVIRDMFAGTLQSRTGLDNRGKGLPAIKALSDAGEIKDLTLVSNTVWARVCDNNYVSMEASFGGTLLYWEIEK
jgi:hypothetical protein